MIKNRIHKLKNNLGGADSQVTTIVLIMKEFGWTYHDMINTPISTYLQVAKVFKKMKDEELKSMKKTKR